ncbi:MAG TPA: ABC transporter substrate-binding protein [Candidatus Binatia bacterium]
MAALTLDLGCGDYDIVRPLKDGAVRAEGMEINFITINRPPEVHWRMGMHQEFDAAEMSFGTFVAGKARGDFPFVGIPAFVYRKFRHSCAYVNTNAGIAKPEDLKGRRVGVPEWQMTATVWLRGFMQDDYGVRPCDVHWLTGGLESSERKEKVALTLPPEIKIENISTGKNLSDMLVAGEIDALFTAQVPLPYVKRAPEVRRLFADARRTETDHFRRTRIFPIMHVMILREELYECHPWIAQSLYKALVESKNRCLEAIFKNDALHSPLPWTGQHADEIRTLMGNDFWPYGVEANRQTIETFLRYCFEQGLTPNPLAVEELFPKATIDTFHV